ncbi:MAG: DUF1501 domain-containing protein [Phycisphaerae bacterium]|nr:DUF1501 domain-containing protein [Phycisphaerae bacterium]
MKNIRLIDRRNFIKSVAGTAAGVAFGSQLGFASGPKPVMGKAKSVIQVWMWGGPSHLDTFDPKPGAGVDYTGPYRKPIETNVKGVYIGQKLPMLAKIADKYAILRGMTHGVFAHETATYLVQTGMQPGEMVYPSLGAVVALKKGFGQEYKGVLPPYICLTQPQGRFSEAGFLGPKYKPFSTGGDPNAGKFIVQGIVAPGGIDDKRLAGRRGLLDKLDRYDAAGNSTLVQADDFQEKAYDLILGDSKKIFDLNLESDELRQKYGRNRFGQSCLLARKLVQQGVPFITINWKGWDTHKKHFESMDKQLPQLDQGLATLISELSEYGLLDSTIVLCGGEFGRSPKVHMDPPWNGGRQHYGHAFSWLVAGGGFKGGQVVGETDQRGEYIRNRPIYPWDLNASIYQQLGIDPLGQLPHPHGCVAYVTPLASGAVQSGGLLTEIM